MFRSSLMRLCVACSSSWNSRTNSELVEAVKSRKISFYGLEDALEPDYRRAIQVRREVVSDRMSSSPDAESKRRGLANIPFEGYEWSDVVGQNCENIVGYIPIPLGMAGPVVIDGKEYPIPMATTEGALVASTHRGARVISQCGGCKTLILGEGMSRAPVVEVESLEEAGRLHKFCSDSFPDIKMAFESTTRFGKLHSLKCVVTGRKAYLRFRAKTGDAMGMNMITKGVEKALGLMQQHFPSLKVLALSGNYCTDKKPSAVNWIEGRGKTVVAEALVRSDLVESTLKSSVDALISLNTDKNLVGSAVAGSVGGFNAQAANVVAAIFIATGQDPAQVVESSTCITTMSKVNNDLLVTVSMPSIEVGTVGGGTGLQAQRGCLDMIGCGGSNTVNPGENAQLLSRVVAAGVLSAELSLMSGLAAGHLLSAHMRLNRKK
ncbi:putative Hydroxymethylglutaryl coenzyme A reductase [Trypanosoma vivax]|uniref:3-hydroxy-3-methylglutaryl coenzyme A reductase n=1 Tax=Trypanosoma vivax (strain Y486) TaxID=1055687 RepID=G0TXB2_TRYVY|nr:putative 3-hydroxy-3-methylglutaryl-CoA reductase [Trypanosoma vivax]KAH8614216.1 putative Hydroxymethylglutaryl coenzyme A reductase [Trypanosoma vivax]CCC48602.1 putative 3-hydroxy-3-methylglutaryl-CoA reductase [Trypanosoma vivax Y486]